eukprot:796604-Amphidinium_carterae.1
MSAERLVLHAWTQRCGANYEPVALAVNQWWANSEPVLPYGRIWLDGACLCAWTLRFWADWSGALAPVPSMADYGCVLQVLPSLLPRVPPVLSATRARVQRLVKRVNLLTSDVMMGAPT